MDTVLTPEEEKNKKRGLSLSIFLHIALVILALIPFLTYPDPPPGQEGIVVNLGLPDVGEGEENAGPATPSEPEVSEPVIEEEVAEPVEESTPPPPETTPDPVEPEPAPQKEVITTEDPEQIALKKRQEEEAKKRAQEEAERKRKAEEEARKKAEAEAERKRQEAEAEARRKAKEAEANKFKDQIGGLFGDKEGKGNTGKPGNQGDPEGDPDASRLEGISTGSGQVGGGLGSRGVVKTSTPQDNSQKQGTVVIRVCVDKSGNVTSADFTQAGSTTSDNSLVQIARQDARKWKFAAGQVDKQCGTITYRFRVK